MAATATVVAAPIFLPATISGHAVPEGWDIGPFVKHQEPVLRPTSESRFTCPVRGKEVRWEERNVYNPAAVVRDGKVYLLYRADDRSPDLGWGRTCRIGLAYSEDGIHFTRHRFCIPITTNGSSTSGRAAAKICTSSRARTGCTA
jgi:hypothetical protein